MDWEDRPSVGRLGYDRASGDVLDIPACEITSNKRTVTDVQVKK